MPWRELEDEAADHSNVTLEESDEEIEPRSFDNDSALGDQDDYDELGSTQSLASSVLNYTYENGRRYHAFRDGQYFMPNDEIEQQGMTLMHHVSLMLLGGELFRAPVEAPLNILEIGTGTGLWAIDVADLYPGAHVIGTDLSPIQPTWVPTNLEFQVDDCESTWCFSHQFDFIHIRNLGGAIADWPKLFRQCYEHLKPGGWLEVSNIEPWGQSNNATLPQNSACYEWQNNLKAAADMFGRELNISPSLEGLIKQAGFEAVRDDQHQVPVSAWVPEKRELAKYFQTLVFIELEALSLRLFTTVLNWTQEQLHALLAEVKKEMRNTAYEMFSMMHYVYGRKPETPLIH